MAASLLCPRRLGADPGNGDGVPVEYQLKANFLAMAPNFVKWPEVTSVGKDKEVLICVYGTFSFGTALASQVRGMTVQSRAVKVEWIRQPERLRACQIVFVSQSEQSRYGKVLGVLQGTSALTVGETADFVEAGGMVSLDGGSEGMQIEVNLASADRAHLKISSRLLVLARRIIGPTAGEKG